MTARDPSGGVPLDALLAHREWVRALARSLVSDPHRADDVEQETWRMAIERPPRHASSLRAWFGTVVRNAARASGRRETRRAEVESTAPPPTQEAPSPADLVAETELQHKLVQAVLELDEPYRATILYRYFEGLAPTEIAARTQTPVDTVKTRLKRGIERLRGRMDDELGDDRGAWCLLVFGRRPVASGAAATGGGAAMALGTKTIAAAALVLVACAVVWRTRATDGVESARRDVARIDTATAAGGDSASSSTKQTRTVAGAETAVKPRAGELEVVVTAKGAPAEDAVVETFAVPPEDAERTFAQQEALRTAKPAASTSTRTDAAGVARLAIGMTGRWIVVVRKRGFAPQAVDVRGVDLAGGLTTRIALSRGFALDGRVLDGLGRGIAGASVVAESTADAWRGAAYRAALAARATTDDAGRFALDDVPAGPLELLAARPGGVSTCVAIARVPSVASIDLALAFDAAIEGVVTDAATCAPVADATIEASAREGSATCAGTTTTDAAGAWRIVGVPLSTVSVTASRTGYLAAAHDGDGRVRLTDGRTTKCDLTLRRGVALTGRVLCGDAPVAGATVTAARAGNSSGERPKTRSAADGAYRFDALAPGEVFVVVSVDGFVQPGFSNQWGDDVRKGAAPRETAVVVPESGEARLDVRVTRGLAVSGRVTGPDGRPAANAGVSLRYEVSCECDGPFRWQDTTTDADGAFRFTGVAATDEATLSAWCGVVGAAYDVKVPLDPAHGADDVALKLLAGDKLLVRVHAPEGIDVADALVQAIGAGRADGDDDPWSAARSDAVAADGTFAADLRPGDGACIVRAVVPGRAWSNSVRVSFGRDAKERRVELTLVVGGGIDGVVQTADGAPIAGARIGVRKPRATDRVVSVSAWGSERMRAESIDVLAVSDAKGEFHLDPLEEGSYELTASALGFTTTTVALTAPTSTPVRVEMSPARRIRGHVRFATGGPAAPVRVSIHPYDDGTQTEARTDADGAFAFEGLRTCDYYLSIDPLPVGANVCPLDVGRLEPRDEPFDFVVAAGLAIGGRVVDESGRPVAGCSIQLFRAGDGPMIERFAGNHASGHSGDDGRFAFQGIEEGRYVLFAAPSRAGPGPLLAPTRVDGVAAGSTALVVTVKAGLAVAGRIVDHDGRPVAGVIVGVEAVRSAGPDPEVDARWRGPMWTPTSTDATGAFRVEGIPAGRCRVVLLGASLAVPSPLQIESDADVRAGDLDLRMVAGGARTIAGVVVDGDDAPTHATVTLTPVDGGTPQTLRTDDTGAFVFVGLDVGRRYRLVASPREHELVAADVETAPGAHALRVRCATGLTAGGRIVRADGSPLAKVLVRLRHGGVENERYAGTDAEGRFVAKGLVAGEYGVEVDVEPGREHDWRDCGALRAGEASTDLRLTR